MNITFKLGSSITQSPNATLIETAIHDAINFYQSEFTNPVTITIAFDFGQVGANGALIPSTAAAQSTTVGNFFNYSTLETRLEQIVFV